MDNFLKEKNKVTILKIQNMYRGLRPEDLDLINPSYSCIFCTKFEKGCTKGKVGQSCPKHEFISEEEFSLRYNF